MYKIVKNMTEIKTVLVNGKDVKIPVDWEVKRLGDVSNISSGRDKKEQNGLYSLFGANGIMGLTNTYNSYKEKTIMGRVGSAGEVHYITGDFGISDNALVFTHSQNSYFFYSAIKNLNIKNIIKKSVMPLISAGDLKKKHILFPSNISQQKEIADFLSHMENTIFKTEELITSMEKRLRYYVRELTSGKLRIKKDGEHIDIVENEHFKTVLVNGKDVEIPVDWEVKKINELCNFINGSAFNNKTWTDSGYKIIRIQNLNGSNDYNYYNGDVNNHVIINSNDVIFSWSGTIDIYRWKLMGDYILNQHIFKVTNTNKLALEYVYYVLQSTLIKIKKLSHGSTMKHITKQNLYSIDVIYPLNLSEQKDIANLLVREEEDIEKMKKLLEMQKKRFKWAMSELLSGRYTLEKTE